ncbi:MAG: SRPBCC family protein [Geminicoccaceae bacterium]|nr:SRPBCC family protein [Geminicoccaceae bacterium]
MKRLLPAAALLALLSGPALAIEVDRTVDLDAPPDEVWSMVGPWCAIGDWHPAVATCTESEEAGKERRLLVLQGGGEILEEETSRDDAARQYGYRILKSPLPVSDYKSTITVDSVGEGKSRVVWKSTFAPKDASQEEAQAAIAGIYEAGLAEIKARMEE